MSHVERDNAEFRAEGGVRLDRVHDRPDRIERRLELIPGAESPDSPPVMAGHDGRWAAYVNTFSRWYYPGRLTLVRSASNVGRKSVAPSATFDRPGKQPSLRRKRRNALRFSALPPLCQRDPADRCRYRVYNQRLTSVSSVSVNRLRGPSSNSVPVRMTYTWSEIPIAPLMFWSTSRIALPCPASRAISS